MPNSFTVFPGIIPGNLTVQGNVTIAGDQLRIGAAAPFVRLGKKNNGQHALLSNIGFDAATRDDVSKYGLKYNLDPVAGSLFPDITNPAGTSISDAFTYAIFTDYVTHTHTGTTTEDTIYSKLIPANTLLANGGLDILFRLGASVQGATATTVRLRFTSGLLDQFTYTAFGQSIIKWRVRNQNALGTQNVVRTVEAMSGTQPNGTVTVLNHIDFSVDQTMTITIQNGTSTDSQDTDTLTVNQVNSFGPV